MKTIEGAWYAATAKSVLANFSPSPSHLLVRSEDEIEKNVAPLSCAIAFAIVVLPVPVSINQPEDEPYVWIQREAKDEQTETYQEVQTTAILSGRHANR